MSKTIKLLGIREAAAMLGVNPETLRRWDKEGKLVAIKISKRGDRRYKKEDLEDFLNKISK
jgi:DNA (cytosine-5)-methyltransferase 1